MQPPLPSLTATWHDDTYPAIFIEILASTKPRVSLIKPGGKRNPGAPKASDFADLGQVKKYLHKTVIGAAHYSGTCAMMPREMGGVVDSKLRVYRCRNLRVCDASNISMMPQADTQAVVYGVAERAAEIIKSSVD